MCFRALVKTFLRLLRRNALLLLTELLARTRAAQMTSPASSRSVYTIHLSSLYFIELLGLQCVRVFARSVLLLACPMCCLRVKISLYDPDAVADFLWATTTTTTCGSNPRVFIGVSHFFYSSLFLVSGPVIFFPLFSFFHFFRSLSLDLAKGFKNVLSLCSVKVSAAPSILRRSGHEKRIL